MIPVVLKEFIFSCSQKTEELSPKYLNGAKMVLNHLQAETVRV
jgi:hypothetical protein